MQIFKNIFEFYIFIRVNDQCLHVGGKKWKEKSVNDQNFETIGKFRLCLLLESRNINVLYVFYSLFLVYI